ncbi:choice-of-anchor Y domain-containing protein, partial [Leptothoe kymatousa]
MATDLFISEYVEGSNSNRALELYNNTGAPVDLSGYTLEIYINGGSSPSRTIALSGSVQNDDVFVIAHPNADAAILAVSDLTSTNILFTGDDAVVFKNGAGDVIDSIGQVGVDPGAQWGSDLTSTANNTLRRKHPSIDAGDTDPTDAFDPATEWEGFANNEFAGLGEHPTTVPNTAPTITVSAGNVSYTENANSVVIAGQATAADTTPNYDAATLTVSFSANGTANDVLEIRNQGTGAGQVGVAGSDVTYQGTVVGSVAGGTGLTPLQVTFNANANPTAVQAVMRNAVYGNSSDAPDTATRTVQFVLTDGDGAPSNAATRDIDVTAVNDAPVNNFPDPQSVNEEQPLVFNGTNNNLISITDIDAGNGTVSVQLGSFNGTLSVVNVGSATVTDNNSGQVTIEGTLTEVNNALDGLTFTPDDNFTGNTSIQITANDNGFSGTGGAKTDNNFIQVSVLDANDAPEISLPGGATTYAENAIPVPINGTAFVSDIDSSNFNGGNLTIEIATGSTANDRLAIQNQGDGTGQIGLNGRIVTYEGTRIGTLAGGTRFDTSLAPLVITFDAAPAIDVLPEVVQALLRNVTYANISENPDGANRTVQVVLEESDTTANAPVAQTINITTANDSPLLGTTLLRYDGALGTLPDAQGWTYVGPGVTPTVGGGVTNVDTTANASLLAGFSRSDQTLDASAGFTISFTARVNAESHAGSDKDGDGVDDRAGFSVLIVSNDPSKAIELDFWSDRIWAQSDGATQDDPSVEPDDASATGFETLFTQAEGATFDTTSLANYDLTIQGDSYTLYANGTAILSGKLKDYQAFNGAIDPYDDPNLIAFSDNTASAQANIDLASVAVTTATNPVNAAYTENAPVGTAVFDDLLITDLDSPQLTGASLTISAGFTADDQLDFTNQNGITGSYINGVLTLSGNASVADYQTAIQSITYSSTSEDPTAGSASRTIDIVVSDGTASNTLSRIVDITPLNDDPQIAGPITVTQTENDGVFTVDLLSTASDPDSADTINVTNLTLDGGDNSGVTILGNTISIDASAYGDLSVGNSEVISYSYTITDGNGGAVAQTATITITGANGTPTVAAAITETQTEDAGTFVVNLLDGATDP